METSKTNINNAHIESR